MSIPTLIEIEHHDLPALDKFGHTLPTGLSDSGAMSVAPVNVQLGVRRLMWFDGEKYQEFSFKDNHEREVIYGTSMGISPCGKYVCGVAREHGMERMFRYDTESGETEKFVKISDVSNPRQAYGVNSAGLVAGFGSTAQGGRGYLGLIGTQHDFRPGTSRFFAISGNLVVGLGGSRAIVYDKTSQGLTPLDKGDSTYGAAFGLSPDGKYIVGTVRDRQRRWRPAVWVKDGKTWKLKIPSFNTDENGDVSSGIALDVNSNGIVLVTRFRDDLDPQRTVVYGARRAPFETTEKEDVAEPYLADANGSTAYPLGWFTPPKEKVSSLSIITEDNLVAGYYRNEKNLARPLTGRLVGGFGS